MSPLEQQFDDLDQRVRTLIGLLEEAEETYWVAYFRRSLGQLAERRLSGATFVLGGFGGQDTFSDLVIGRRWQDADPLRFRNLNARLSHLRTGTFEAANAITSRRAW